MAQPPPPQAPPVAGQPPPAIAEPPRTYAALYSHRDDVLAGNYAGLYTDFLTVAVPPAQPQVLSEAVFAAAEDIPKVFLCLVEDAPGQYTTRTVHRWTIYPRSAAADRATAWDGRGFAFMSDVRPGNHITVVEVPNNAFHLTPNATITNDGMITGLVGPNVAAPLDIIPPVGPQDPGSRLIRTRYFVRVPHVYVGLVLGQRFTPADLWNALEPAIQADGRAVMCRALLDWMGLALTLRPDPNNPNGAPLPPAPLLGPAATALTRPEIDDPLQAFIWRTLRADLPALDPTTASTTDQVMALIGVVRQEHQAQRAVDAAERANKARPKLTSVAFPVLTVQWMRFTEVLNESALPELYTQWANCTKGERRPTLERLVRERCRVPGAATSIPPHHLKGNLRDCLHGKLCSDCL